MGSRRVSLLGVPRVERGDAVVQPKGKKAWAVLTYLLLSDLPRTRLHLAELLFGNAEDPLGALRWNLAQIRRVLDMPRALRGPELKLDIGSELVVDTDVLTSGPWAEAVTLRGLGSDLLEGMTFRSDPIFDTWLSLERERIRGVQYSVLRTAAAASLGMGRPEMAADFAARCLTVDRFDEAGHELLIRSLAAAGLHDQAEEALQRCIQIFADELQAQPGPAIKEAIRNESLPRSIQIGGASTAAAQLELGRSAIKAGAVDTGIEGLRTAVWAAEQGADNALLAECLFSLAYALIHSVRGRDGEASALLHRALGIAELHGEALLASGCHRELGYIEMLIGSYDRALATLGRSLEVGSSDSGGDAWTFAYQAICYSDTGRYAKAIDRLERCMRAAAEAGGAQQEAYALCLSGRIHMLRGEFTEARDSLERSISIAMGCGWTVLLPWPRALLAEVDLHQGVPLPDVSARLEQALSLARQIGDPCWEGAAMHGLGLVDAASGQPDAAVTCLADASAVCARFPDSYIWMKGYVLDALCDITTQHPGAQPDRWIDELQRLSARTGMNELLARAQLYRARSGDEDALKLAIVLSREVDNPALARLF